MGNYSTAPNTRSLSIAALGTTPPLTVDPSTNSALLYYENPSGNVSALLQQGGGWVDITSQESKSLPQEFRNIEESDSYTLYDSGELGTLSTPFACGANWSGPGTIGAIFYTPNGLISNTTSPANVRFTGNLYSIGSSGPGHLFLTCMNYTPGALYKLSISWLTSKIVAITSSSDISSIRNHSSIHQSDIALFSRAGAIWINGTQPVVEYAADTPGPDSEFPLTRLASVTLADYSFT